MAYITVMDITGLTPLFLFSSAIKATRRPATFITIRTAITGITHPLGTSIDPFTPELILIIIPEATPMPPSPGVFIDIDT